MKDFSNFFAGKRILITGGTGSIGHILTDQLLKYDVEMIRVMSRHEDLQIQMQRDYLDKRMNFLLGDVRDYDRCLTATKGMDIVIHAAALKHISDIERHPSEAVKTNVIGTMHVKRASMENKVSNFIGISTDKATKPINMYGATKALDEKIILINEEPTDTKFSVVRYGNVVGSRGSVIPLWYKLAKEGQPLQLTDARMTRFWFLLEEAMELIFVSLQTPDRLVVKKCKAFKMEDLAALYATKYKVPIKNVGLRAGEKIHEALLNDLEYRKAVLKDGYFVVDYNGKDIRDDIVDFTSDIAEQITEKDMIRILQKEGFYA